MWGATIKEGQSAGLTCNPVLRTVPVVHQDLRRYPADDVVIVDTTQTPVFGDVVVLFMHQMRSMVPAVCMGILISMDTDTIMIRQDLPVSIQRNISRCTVSAVHKVINVRDVIGR